MVDAVRLNDRYNSFLVSQYFGAVVHINLCPRFQPRGSYCSAALSGNMACPLRRTSKLFYYAYNTKSEDSNKTQSDSRRINKTAHSCKEFQERESSDRASGSGSRNYAQALWPCSPARPLSPRSGSGDLCNATACVPHPLGE